MPRRAHATIIPEPPVPPVTDDPPSEPSAPPTVPVPEPDPTRSPVLPPSEPSNTYEELYDEARRRGLRGRSSMTKTELARALGR